MLDQPIKLTGAVPLDESPSEPLRAAAGSVRNRRRSGIEPFAGKPEPTPATLPNDIMLTDPPPEPITARHRGPTPTFVHNSSHTPRVHLVSSDLRHVLKKYSESVGLSCSLHPHFGKPDVYATKALLAKEAAAIYNSELRHRLDLVAGALAPLAGKNQHAFNPNPFLAADYTDPAANLGTLSGTLVSQRALEIFRFEYEGIVKDCFACDFSGEPAGKGQWVNSRVLQSLATAEYNAATDSAGRPLGWNTISPAVTKDVSVQLAYHTGVPIVFDSNTIAATPRKLFDEIAPAASNALATTILERAFSLFTPANFSAYAATNGALVPTAIPYYAVSLETFARGSLGQIASAFNSNKVPLNRRRVLLTAPYFEKCEVDPSVVAMLKARYDDENQVEEAVPKIASFLPLRIPDIAINNATPNFVGFAMQRSGIVLVIRPPRSLNDVLKGVTLGATVPVTNPDTGLTVLLVQYVNHTGGYAEWRIEAVNGSGPGDNRAGLCITSA